MEGEKERWRVVQARKWMTRAMWFFPSRDQGLVMIDKSSF